MFRHLLIALAGILLTPSIGMAWDFTCSPRSVTEIEPTNPPNMMLMLDKSGSMKEDGAPSTCNVCERPDQTRFKVNGLAQCPATPGLWPAPTPTLNSQVSSSPNITGYSHVFNFTGLQPAAAGTLNLELSVQGDFDDKCGGFQVWVDGVFFKDVSDFKTKCDQTHNVTLSGLPLSAADDGKITIVVKTNPDVGSCDAVDSGACTTAQNIASARLLNKGLTYRGTQAAYDPCGATSKWEQAYSAIDSMTGESSALEPDLVAFGLGLFSGSTSTIENECEQNNHVTIMNTLDANGPGGATPTALAIRTSLNSTCVKGALAGNVAVTDSQVQPKTDNLENFKYVHNLIVTPQTTNSTLTIDLTGDYNDTCEYADIFAYDATTRAYNPMVPPPASLKIGTHNGSTTQCNGATQAFTVPPSATTSGSLRIEVWNSSTTYAGKAGCFGKDGVQAFCATNSSKSKLIFKSELQRAAATVLITDGEPNGEYDGEKSSPAAVLAACEHRKFANLYVVGQGGGTDVDFNNILAAAGGSGSCDGGVDPCADFRGYDSLRGKCSGAYQTDNSAQLLAAISAITNEIQCLFEVNFLGAPVSSIPIDPTNEYPYLYIQGRFSGVGNGRIYQKNSPLADPPNQGWEFATSTEPKRVRLTDLYCNMIQVRTINQVATQLACLCEQDTGSTCTVPDSEFLGVCPEGVWACSEGTDYCEPDATCCEAGLGCTVPGLEGVCAAGITTCPSPTRPPVCEQVVFPSTEICNGLDDDCDGEVDEIGGTCTVPGGVGRCAPGMRACSGNMEVCLPEFEPMPELCNGLDDDCDGNKDNITKSWASFSGTYTLPSADRPKACDIKNSCVCAPGVSDNHAGNDFTSYVAEWSNSCECGEGLEFTEFEQSLPAEASATTVDAPEGDGPQTGCSAVDGGLAPLGLLAFFGLVRRRRN